MDERQELVAQPQVPAASLMRSMRCSELLRTRTSSRTASCGMAKRSPAASTMSAETMASVSGILMVKVVPRPRDRFHVDRAADLVDIGAHDIHADAAARHARDLVGGREAGREDELLHLRLGHLVDLGFRGETDARSTLALIRSVSRPRPSSEISMMIWPPS